MNVSLIHLKSVFGVPAGVSCARKALSRAGGVGGLCPTVKQRGTGTPLEKASLEFKILKGESFGLSKDFFAIGEKKINICLKYFFFALSAKGWIWESKTIFPKSG